MATDESKPSNRIDLAVLSARAVRQSVHDIADQQQLPSSESGAIEIVGARGQHNMLMGISRNVKLNVRGDLGDYAMALNDGAHARVAGQVGAGLGESMVQGSVRVHGAAGVGVGVGMTGGTIAVYGNAGDGCGSALQGGEIFVRGNAGNNTACSALHGTLVIGGDAGHNLGESMVDGTIFIRGKVASLGRGVTEAPLVAKDSMRLGLLLINAGIRGEAVDFRRVIPTSIYESERASHGVVGHPSWR